MKKIIKKIKKFFFLQTLGTLQGEETGSVSVKIRTTETSGIILYNTGQVGSIFFFVNFKISSVVFS